MKLSNFLSNNKSDRIFIFQSSVRLNVKQLKFINDALKNGFFPKWASHSKKLNPELLLLCNHFIVISSCEDRISGCSMDSLSREMKKIASDLCIELFDRMNIATCVMTNNQIKSVDELNTMHIDIVKYRYLINNYDNTKKNLFVFDNTITNAEDNWIIPFKQWFLKNKS